MSTPVKTPKDTVHFAITADAHPAALSRIVELFTLRNITPDLIRACCYKSPAFPDEILSVDIHVFGLSVPEQDIIRHNMAAQILVHSVRQENLYQKSPAKLAS
ncbi:hypothetical protein MNBD_ALPHA02-1229 [hydrothermal vent metagenome]|uniref:ACT domain-containing protein n=1 Tax=hydrothermal vent metagenome TaxID=652676 RepID=A0A3B0RNM3_9ZZZZ